MLEGGRKQSSGKETGEWGDRWVRRRGKTVLPPPGEGGPTSDTLAAVSPTPKRPGEVEGEVEDSDVIVAGIAFILSRARHICMLCDNWPVIWTGVSQ